MELQQALIDSCSIGDLDTFSTYMQQCIQYGVDMNFAVQEGMSLITYTVISSATNPNGRHLDIVQYMLQTGVNHFDIPDDNGRTAAHWAAHTRQSEMLGLLILSGSSMSVYDQEGHTPFHVAIISESQECVNIVLQLMPGVTQLFELPTANGLTPLMLAVQQGSKQMCQLLIDGGSDPNAIEEVSHQTAMHFAAERGYGSIVELLLKRQCRLDANDARGVTPVHIAAALVQSNVLEVICDKVGSEVLDIQDNMGLTALMHACAGGSEQCVKYILKKKIDILMKDSSEGKTCLHWAAGNADSPSIIIQMLCRKRRQLIEEKDTYGRTPLHLAAMGGNVEGIRALNTAGCNMNAIDTNNEYTAIHWAAVGGQAAALAELISLGCSSQEMDKNGATALHMASQAAVLATEEATQYKTGALECIEVLLNAGVSINVVDNFGQTPMHWALQCANNEDCLQLLINEGGDPRGTDNNGLTGLHIAAKYGVTNNCQYLIETIGIPGNIEDTQGQTALFYSIESNAIECSEYLLKIGCSPNHRNHSQRSPAHIAGSVNSVEGLQLLLQFNADFNVQSDQNATPLHDAAANGYTDALQFLLSCGADPNINGDISSVPSVLHFAVSGNHNECVELLLQSGANINTIMLSDEDQPLSPLDYVSDNETLLELIQINGGQPGVDMYTPPSPEPLSSPTIIEKKTKIEEKEILQEVAQVIYQQDKETEDSIQLDEQESEVKPRKEEAIGLVRRLRPIRSRPTSGMEVFDHVTPPTANEERFPTRRTSVLSRAMSLLRQKSPPPESIQSSVIGLCAAHVTMLAASVIGTTPLGDKTIEVAMKVATDTAEELKRQAEEIDYEPTELVWLNEPEKEPTPPPEPSPVIPPTPPSSPPPKFELEMDQFERRMRKAKAQMDCTKSLGYRAVEELLRAQTTQSRLKRQFMMSSLKEESEKKREQFFKEETKARKESEGILSNYQKKMEKATKASTEINKLIDKQLTEAHRQNQEISTAMTELGVNPRPTVSEWIKQKQEDKRIQIKGTLQEWERTKQQREMAISLKQAITSHRALQHVAWGVKKDLKVQMKALDQPRVASTGFGIKLNTTSYSTRHTSIARIKKTTPQAVTHQSRPSKFTAKSLERTFTSNGCVRATPFGFRKIREEDEERTKKNKEMRRTSSLPDSMLWDMGKLYVDRRERFYSRVGHRAYGPKDVRPGRPFLLVPPDKYGKLEPFGILPPKSSSHIKREPIKRETQQKHSNTIVQYHSLADSYPPVTDTGSRKIKLASGQVLPMKVLDKSEVMAKITV